MKKITVLLVLLSINAITFASQVNFLSWVSYLDPKTIPAFEKQSGIKVNQSYFDGGDMLRAKLLAGGSGYDVVMPALANFPQYIKAKLLQPIDKSKLSNYQYQNKALYKIADQIDPGNKYGVIYTYGTTGIAYNKQMVQKALGSNAPVNSWKILFDPKYLKKLQGCGVSFLGSPVQVFGITLKYLGYNPNTQDPEALKAAAAHLMKIRKYLTYFSNNRYIFDLASGNICIAMAYSGDTLRAEKLAAGSQDGVQLDYKVVKDAMPIWFDMLAIPANAPHPENALKFINDLLDPDVAASNSNFIMQPNATNFTKDLLPQLKQPGITPSNAALQKAFILRFSTEKMQPFISRLWFSVKYGVPLQ